MVSANAKKYFVYVACFRSTVMCTMYISNIIIKRTIHSSSPQLAFYTCLLKNFSLSWQTLKVALVARNLHICKKQSRWLCTSQQCTACRFFPICNQIDALLHTFICYSWMHLLRKTSDPFRLFYFFILPFSSSKPPHSVQNDPHTVLPIFICYLPYFFSISPLQSTSVPLLFSTTLPINPA